MRLSRPVPSRLVSPSLDPRARGLSWSWIAMSANCGCRESCRAPDLASRLICKAPGRVKTKRLIGCVTCSPRASSCRLRGLDGPGVKVEPPRTNDLDTGPSSPEHSAARKRVVCAQVLGCIPVCAGGWGRVGRVPPRRSPSLISLRGAWWLVPATGCVIGCPRLGGFGAAAHSLEPGPGGAWAAGRWREPAVGPPASSPANELTGCGRE